MNAHFNNTVRFFVSNVVFSDGSVIANFDINFYTSLGDPIADFDAAIQEAIDNNQLIGKLTFQCKNISFNSIFIETCGFFIVVIPTEPTTTVEPTTDVTSEEPTTADVTDDVTEDTPDTTTEGEEGGDSGGLSSTEVALVVVGVVIGLLFIIGIVFVVLCVTSRTRHNRSSARSRACKSTEQ